MKKEFIETPFFTKRWYALGFNDEDLAELQQFLLKNPQAGDMMVALEVFGKSVLHSKEKVKGEVLGYVTSILRPSKGLI